MIKGLYTVKDVVVGSFFEIKIYPNDACALRDFDILCQEAKFPKDLQFYKLGTYDNVTGDIVPKVEFMKAGGEDELS